MISVKKALGFCVLLIASAFTTPGWASPLVFEFTGTISDTVLISGVNQTLFTTHPEWNEKRVAGRLTMDFSALAESPFNGSGYTQYSKNGITNLTADWMSFLVNNPDDTFLDISDSEPIIPAPEAESDDAYTDLSHHSYMNGSSGFYAQRSYTNTPNYPQKHASLWLAALGDNAEWLTSNVDYNTVIIKPEFANWFNYGYVRYYTELGVGYEYTFTIDSLERVDATVPEPSMWLLMIVGLLLICRNRTYVRL